MKSQNLIFTIFCFFFSSLALSAAGPTFTIESTAENLNHPWSLTFLPEHGDGPGEERILLTERPGNLLYLSRGKRKTVTGLPEVAAVGQGGLLDIILSPDFEKDSFIYFTFAEAGKGGYGTVVARGRLHGLENEIPQLENLEILYRALPRSEGGRHFGSRLAFDRSGHLYVTLGERGTMERAQNPFDPYGSVLRLNSDGSIPGDNPFAESGEQAGEGAGEIWSWGHRNPQGLTVHPLSGEIWIHEHGPRGGDEVNIIQKGGNYGWPILTYGIDYDGSIISMRQTAPGFTEPLLQWTPSIAPSGMAFYLGEDFPEWQGDLFVGALAGEQLRRIEFRDGRVFYEEPLLVGRVGRIRDVRVSPGGMIWLITDADNGGLYRIRPGS